MILESIITTTSRSGDTHVAPMGIWRDADVFTIAPFRPSTTLSNLLETRCAVVNFTDDVRLFAGPLSGRKDFALTETEFVSGRRVQGALAHAEVELIETLDDPQRPKLRCVVRHEQVHAGFQGFNRAQAAVVEAAILVSRLDRLPKEKIMTEMDYLQIAIDKTAGPRELEAWGWLRARVDAWMSDAVARQP